MDKEKKEKLVFFKLDEEMLSYVNDDPTRPRDERGFIIESLAKMNKEWEMFQEECMAAGLTDGGELPKDLSKKKRDIYEWFYHISNKAYGLALIILQEYDSLIQESGVEIAYDFVISEMRTSHEKEVMTKRLINFFKKGNNIKFYEEWLENEGLHRSFLNEEIKAAGASVEGNVMYYHRRGQLDEIDRRARLMKLELAEELEEYGETK